MTLTLYKVLWKKDLLYYSWKGGGREYSTSIKYQGADLTDLEQRYGRAFLEQIVFQIIAFDSLKFLSSRPQRLDFGSLAQYASQEWHQLWSTVVHHVSGEWRYRNNVRTLQLPHVELCSDRDIISTSVSESDGVLLLFGGGKDSAVSASLCESIGLAYSTCAYTKNIYGSSRKQNVLIDNLLDRFHPKERLGFVVTDSFFQRDESGDAFEGETPWSLFAVLPLLLTKNLRHVVIGNEKSADVGNVEWEGEEINHQWGKSWEAEKLLDAYLGRLIPGARYWSILKPVRDSVIFQLLDPHIVPYTHSCNIDKPWCNICPKCAYVLLGFLTYLPGYRHLQSVVDDPQNHIWFRQMCGLDEHTPFECIGERDEARLMFALLRKKNLQGSIIRELGYSCLSALSPSVYLRLAEVDSVHHGIPTELAPKLLMLMLKASKRFIHLVESSADMEASYEQPTK